MTGLTPQYETRWALESRFAFGWSLLGRFCWPDATADEQQTRTFRTRKLARAAQRKMTSYRAESRVVKVEVVIFRLAQGE